MLLIESKITYHARPVKFIPALGIGSLTPFFDDLQKWGAKEETFKPLLINQAKIQANFRVLDLGCGTGTLTLLAKKTQPKAIVIGIDIDPNILGIAKSKAAQANLHVRFDHGTAFNLPYPDGSFDRIISSLVLHHLTRENKLKALKEALRVLKRNGELHIADIGKPQNALMRLPAVIMRRLEETEDNVKGLIPNMLKSAGFVGVEETSKLMTMFGTVSLYKGIKNDD